MGIISVLNLMKESKLRVSRKDRCCIWIQKIYCHLIDSHKNQNHNQEQEDLLVVLEDKEEDLEVDSEELREEGQGEHPEVTSEEDHQEEEAASEVVEEEDDDV